jgi:hypothetical protein
MLTRAHYNSVIDTLGVPAEYCHIKTQEKILINKVGISTNKSNEALVNAYGVGGKTITIKQSSLSMTPEKFDYVIINGEKMVFDFVTSVHEAGTGTVIGYRAYCVGKQ